MTVRATIKILTILLIALPTCANSQDQFVGTYRDNFGNQLQLNSDRTFKYTWHFDLASSWTKGTWTMKNDTVYFIMVPIYDTLTFENELKQNVDTLILSADESPDRISTVQAVTTFISGGGQNRSDYPQKLVFKSERLYRIENGRLVTEKVKGLWSTDKLEPWYYKTSD